MHGCIAYAHGLHLEEIPWEHYYGRTRGARRAFMARDLSAFRGVVIMASLKQSIGQRQLKRALLNTFEKLKR